MEEPAMTRFDGRAANELRPIRITMNFIESALGSALVEWGKTRVICTVTEDERPPSFLRGTGKGWVSAEYGMLPGSTNTRKQRDRKSGPDGRSVEIQRLIGRSLRAVVDTGKLGERTLWADCDVIQADGGTRCCSITGAWLALVAAVDKLLAQGKLESSPITGQVAAVSVGLLPQLGAVADLCYQEDSGADVDMNLVMTDAGEFVEVQGTGESRSFTRAELNELLALGEEALQKVMALQREQLGAMMQHVG